jgi:hypothetical protein
MDQDPFDNDDPFNGLLEEIVTIIITAAISGLILAYLLN